MASAAQVQANRANAQKSTGPQTPEGKAAVALNAVKHGLRAQAAVLPGEEPDQYGRYHEAMLGEMGPEGLQEVELAERIVSLSWRLRRAGRYENAIFEALYDQQATALAATSTAPEAQADGAEAGDLVLGRMLVADFSGPRVLERALLYERRIESSLCRAWADWRELRAQPWPSEKRPTIRPAGRRDGPAVPTPDSVPGAPTTNRAVGPVCQTKPIGPRPPGSNGISGTNKPKGAGPTVGEQAPVNKQSQYQFPALSDPAIAGTNKANFQDEISRLAGLSLPKWGRMNVALGRL